MASLHADEALAQINSISAAPAEQTLLILAEAGMGKSHVLKRAQQAATTRAVLIPAHTSEADFPLSGFAAVFAAVRNQPAEDFARYFTLRSDTPEALFAAAHDLLVLIQGLELEPTLVLIDDIERMDITSQKLIATMSRRLAGTGLWLVATARSVSGDSPLTSMPAVHLQPLSLDQVILEGAKDMAYDEATMRIIAGYVGGNPRVMAEQLAVTHADQLAGSEWLRLPAVLTPGITAVTDPMLSSLRAEERLILEHVSLAPLSHAAAIGQLCPDAADILEDLIDAQLLRSHGTFVRFVDQRLRSRLYWEQGSRIRREHHGVLAEATAPHDSRLRTWHETGAALGLQGVDELIHAAISFLQEGHLEVAVEFMERALDRAASLEAHASEIIQTCWWLMREGELSLASRYIQQLQPHALAPGLAMDIYTIRLTTEMFRTRRLVDDEVRTLVEAHASDNPDAVNNLVILAAMHRAERWEAEEAGAILEPALQLEPRLSDGSAAKLIATKEVIDAIAGTNPDPNQPPQEGGDDLADRAPDLLLIQARALTWREKYAEARHILTLVRNRAVVVDRLWSDLATYAAIGNEIRAGDFRRARRAIESWGNGSPWIDRGQAVHVLVRGWDAYARGDMDDAFALLEQCLDLASQEASQAIRARALAVRGAANLMMGNPEASVMDLRQVSSISTRIRNPSLLRHWADYTEACILTDRVQEASAATAALERRLATTHSRWGQLALMRCRALIDKGASSLDTFDLAVKEFTRHDSPYSLGRTLSSLADRQEMLGADVDARRTRMNAEAAFEAAGADAWLARTKPQVQESAVAAADALLERLTKEEQEVARLVLRGMRNREMADALFISTRTVELRLTRIYRALGVSSRAQLLAVLASGITDAVSPDIAI